MKHFPARSFRRILTLGIAGAAFAVPVAQAMAKPLPPIDAGSSIPNPVYTQQQVRPDDRAGIRGPGVTSEPAPLAAVGSGDGFNWNDAGIGAAISFAAALFLLAATVLLRRNRRGQLAV